MKKCNVAVVGVGAVGQIMVRVLKQRNFPMNSLKVLARSARLMEIAGEKYEVRKTEPEEFEGIDIALFAGTEGEKGAAITFGKEAVKRGAVVIDNGADFRLDPTVPLVVPEVNPEDVKWHKGLLANPNCSTIQMVMAIAPIYKLSRIKRIVIATYQATSGAGGKAPAELRRQAEQYLKTGEPGEAETMPHPIAFSMIPHIGKFEDLDYTTEEWKTVRETHKIMHDDKIAITCTAVRVPTFNVHGEAIYLETEKKLSVDEVRNTLSEAPGVKVIDEPDTKAPSEDKKRRTYPLPSDADDLDDVYVGRIRQDPFVENGIVLWCVGDNVRKGAALNAVQIAELLR